jgi:phosphopantetheinyl transferase (holo-ACP synthase)
MSSRFYSTFSIVLLVRGHPERSSSTDTQPALKCECHSVTAVWLKECFLKALQRISSVSVADLQSFAQNLMQTHCSILPSIADKMKHEVKKALF